MSRGEGTLHSANVLIALAWKFACTLQHGMYAHLQITHHCCHCEGKSRAADLSLPWGCRRGHFMQDSLHHEAAARAGG